MLPHQIQSSPRSITCTTANLVQHDGIKTTIATDATAGGVTYTGAAINGTHVVANIAYPFPDNHVGVAQYPMARAAGSAGSYVNGSTLVFTGTYGGLPATSTATVVGANGGADFIGASPLDSASSVHIDAQTNAGGAWELGWTDLACRRNQPFRALRVNAAGNVDVRYFSGDFDLVPFLAGESQMIEPIHIVQATTTAASFTVYE